MLSPATINTLSVEDLACLVKKGMTGSSIGDVVPGARGKF